jgi:hypothetical protein
MFGCDMKQFKCNTISDWNLHAMNDLNNRIRLYRLFRTQADWTFNLPSEFPAKELRHLPRKMPPRSTSY